MSCLKIAVCNKTLRLLHPNTEYRKPRKSLEWAENRIVIVRGFTSYSFQSRGET